MLRLHLEYLEVVESMLLELTGMACLNLLWRLRLRGGSASAFAELLNNFARHSANHKNAFSTRVSRQGLLRLLPNFLVLFVLGTGFVYPPVDDVSVTKSMGTEGIHNLAAL